MVVGVDAELEELSVDDVSQSEDKIVSQWREVSSAEKRHLRDRVDEIFRPLGLQARLVVLERANSLAMFFICMTLSALMSLRVQWSNGQLKDIVQSLFTFLSAATRTVRINRLSWPETDYERSLTVFTSVPGNRIIL